MRTIALLVAALVSSIAIAQDKAAKPAAPSPAVKEVAVGDVAKVSATVVSVDQATRVVVLKGPEGNSVRFVAGPEVKNLAQVQVGDIVTLEYAQAVAISLKKTSSQVRERVVTEASKSAAPGQKPGAVVMRDVKVIATVQAVDAAKGTVTLRGPEHTVSLKVRDPAVLKGVKVGENVEVEYTEAAAIKVEKAPAAPAAPAAAAKPAAPAAPAAPAKK
jgi:Cu/Ag efflux protein CusF